MNVTGTLSSVVLTFELDTESRQVVITAESSVHGSHLYVQLLNSSNQRPEVQMWRTRYTEAARVLLTAVLQDALRCTLCLTDELLASSCFVTNKSLRYPTTQHSATPLACGARLTSMCAQSEPVNIDAGSTQVGSTSSTNNSRLSHNSNTSDSVYERASSSVGEERLPLAEIEDCPKLIRMREEYSLEGLRTEYTAGKGSKNTSRGLLENTCDQALARTQLGYSDWPVFSCASKREHVKSECVASEISAQNSHCIFNLHIDDNSSIDCDDEGEVRSDRHREHATDEFLDQPSTNLATKVVEIEWADNLRRGGDAYYDPACDGCIYLEGMCVTPDPLVNSEVQWSSMSATVLGVKLSQLLNSKTALHIVSGGVYAHDWGVCSQVQEEATASGMVPLVVLCCKRVCVRSKVKS